MNKKEFLESIRKQIHFVFDRDSIELEYIQHIEDSILDLMEDGYSKEEAERIAIEQMGDPIEIGKQLNEEHHPLLGYLWVTSKIILAFTFLILGVFIVSNRHDVSEFLIPRVEDNKIDTIHLDMKVDMPAHIVYLDKIIQVEGYNGEAYTLTYRSFIKYDVSRSGASSPLFIIEDNPDGQTMAGSSDWEVFFGSYGDKAFYYPDNDVIRLVFDDGQEIELNLEELCHEKK